jgi:acetyl-CoA carboxylase biotin carboxyl carrier protein
MEIEHVRELVKLVEESGIEELEISQKDTTIRIQKSRPMAVTTGATAAIPFPSTAWPAPPAASGPGIAGPATEPTAATDVDQERAKWKEIRSPIVGTFYKAPAPGADPFVRVGDRVSLGQTLCIIEAMKVMNEIEAEFAGEIREILAEDAAPVEAEAVLYLVEPI